MFTTPRAMLLGLCLLPALAGAEPRAGLWEFTSQMQQDGQAMPDMQQMLEQLQKLPPEQRQMMEQMLAQQGVKLGGGGVQLCLSEASAKARDIPLQDPDSGCTQEITERSAEVTSSNLRGRVKVGAGLSFGVSARGRMVEIEGR